MSTNLKNTERGRRKNKTKTKGTIPMITSVQTGDLTLAFLPVTSYNVCHQNLTQAKNWMKISVIFYQQRHVQHHLFLFVNYFYSVFLQPPVRFYLNTPIWLNWNDNWFLVALGSESRHLGNISVIKVHSEAKNFYLDFYLEIFQFPALWYSLNCY